MSDSVRPHRRQPTRLPCPWDSPGKNSGVGCHCLLQCMKVKSESEVAQLYLLRNPMDCSPPGSTVHGIFQARVLEWGNAKKPKFPSEFKAAIFKSFLKIIYVCISFPLRWAFVAACGLSVVAASRGLLCTVACFSVQWLCLSQSTGCRRAGFSTRGSWTLEFGLSSCGPQVLVAPWHVESPWTRD